MSKNEYLNTILELLTLNLKVMFIPTYSIFSDGYKLKYSYMNIYKNFYVYQDNYVFNQFDTCFYVSVLESGKCVVVELEKGGSLIFVGDETDDLFQILQKHYSNNTSYVFKGNETGGYFKILKDGKIQRKIASFLKINGVVNYPETRGKPCEYEIERNKIYKMDMNATYAKDIIKDFYQKEVLDLFDYYVGISNLQIKDISIYSIVENKRGK